MVNTESFEEWLLAKANSMNLGTNDRQKKSSCLGQNVSLKMKKDCEKTVLLLENGMCSYSSEQKENY